MGEQKRFPGSAIGFLLAQLGAHVAGRFAERLAPLSLKPSDAGILRLLAESAGISQQDVASTMHIHPSRLVSIVDDLEGRGLVKRQENADDRRTYALHLTDKGRATLGDIRRIARQHNDAVCASLSLEERDALASLLDRIVKEQGLAAGVHPGYRGGGRPHPG